MEFKLNDKFKSLLEKQRHECRAKRQKVRKYGGEELYKELYEHYILFESYLPKKAKNILDIGCGLGYIDVVINNNKHGLKYYMFDSAKAEGPSVDLFYNDLDLTKEFLLLNGMKEEQIELVDATKTGMDRLKNFCPELFDTLPKMDIIISMYAWGWHSYLSKYINDVARISKKDSVLILDCKGHPDHISYEENKKTIQDAGFEYTKDIQVYENKYLLVATKK